MASEFKIRRLVEFSETDMAGIVHFAEFFQYMEAAEHAFLRSLGFSVHKEWEGRLYGWPRVHAECDFRQPLRFEDEVEVHLLVREKKEKSLAYEFVFRKLDGEAPMEVARGRIVAVCVSIDPETHQMRAVKMPTRMWEQILVHEGPE